MGKKKKAKADHGEFLVCRNPKGEKGFEIEARYECGMVLMGSEVKALRDRNASIEAAFGRVERGELFINNMHIAPYENAKAYGHEPRRRRKLLVHRHQIERIRGRTTVKGSTLIPLAVYFKNGRAKIELALGKSVKRGDKRQDLRRTVDLKEARAAMNRGRRK